MQKKARQEILMTEKESHLWVKNISENDSVNGCYLVKEKKSGTTRRGDLFLTITLADRTGEMEAKVWERAGELSPLFQEGDIIEVDGNAVSYRGRIQITISGLTLANEKSDPEIFFEASPLDASEMIVSLRELLKGIKDVHLKGLLDRFLNDQEFVSVFKKAPAAKNFHHSYVGGLLEHTLSVCRMAEKVAAHYPILDSDLLLTSAFLHDIGKIKELEFDRRIDYTDQGRLLGHVVLGAGMLDEKLRELRGFPLDLAVRLKHLILSHHGQYEFGSPKRPKFLEAFALHLIDDLDAKMNGLARYMEKDRQEGIWTDFNRLFERYFLKGEVQADEKDSEAINSPELGQGSLFSHDA
jgi:3'-5' exoribonuclease